MTTKKIKFGLITSISLGSLFLLSSVSSAITTQDGRFVITGFSEQKVTEFSGVGQSIDINLGSTTLPSGEITFSLDSAKNNRLIYDFDSGKLIFDVHLLLNAPILQQIGALPVSFNLIERATIPAINLLSTFNPNPNPIFFSYQADGTVTQPLFEPQNIQPTGTGLLATGENSFTVEIAELLPEGIIFIGGGTIQSGIFAGFEYFNQNEVRTIPNIPPDIPREPPTKPFPDQPQGVPILEIKIAKVPEPSSTLSLLALGTLGAAFTFNRHKKRNRLTTKAV